MLLDWLKESERNIVLLVFSTSWSGSTHILYTYVRQVAKTIPNMRHHLIDVEEYPELASHFGISQVPVSVILKKREVVDYIRGTVSKRKLLEKLQNETDK